MSGIMMACLNGHFEILKYLIAFGIEVNFIKTWKGMKLIEITEINEKTKENQMVFIQMT